MLSNQNNSVSVCNRLAVPLTSSGVESEARAITKRKRRLQSGMTVLKSRLVDPSPNKVQGTSTFHKFAARNEGRPTRKAGQ
jgi:hypothetical protein